MQEEEEVMAEAALRCICGYSIVCEVRPGGEHIGFLAFFDGETTSETYGQQVENCPGCGEQLGLPLFFRKDRPR
jgi:hypothetical protein